MVMESTGGSVPQTLGSYRIGEMLGRGGMGVVYRARDTRLGRDVAIKILPVLFLADTDRRARFEREARLLASVSHPNIGAIYGFEQAGDVGGLVLELVEGPTLAERIAQGSIAITDALPIARQIADALHAAHERGIVHRDLKPANIKVRSDDTVKVLDFGLAKAMPDEATSSDWSQSPTVTNEGTREGLVVGTVAYMSPEQARGRAVDKRSDIWAFGCILFEMLTGRAVFGRETLTDTLAAIVDRDPDWRALPGATPPALRRLLTRCLEKDPKRRLHDIADARIEIDDVIANPAEAPGAVRQSRRREYLAWTAAAAGLGVAVAAILLPSRRAPDSSAPPPVARTSVVLAPGEQLSGRGREYALALSRDGSQLVYLGARGGQEQLSLRRLDDLDAKDLPGTAGARQPFFSPDGHWIGFFADNALQKIAVAGGLPIRIADVPGISLGASWGADDTIVFAVFQSGLFKIPASGGTARPLETGSQGAWPEILPDGRTVLFTSAGSAVLAIDLAGGNSRTLGVRSATSGPDGAARLGGAFIKEVRYLPTGHLVYGQDPGSIRAVAFDLRSLTIQGDPVSLVDGVYTSSNGGATYFAVSRSGLLAYARESRQRQLQWVDRSGRGTPITDDRERFRFPELSPDGKRVAVVIDSELRRSDIWIYDANRGTKTRLTTEKHNLTPVWWPDGSRITYYSTGILASKLADGSGTEEVLLSGTTRYPNSWSPDGRELLFHADDPVTGADLWVLRSGAAGGPRPLLVRSFHDHHARFSRDGRWIAYMSNESGRDEVYAMSYPELRGKVAVSTEGGTHPIWSHDGRELFYRQGPSLMAVAVDTTKGFRAETPQVLFDASVYAGAGGDTSFDVSPDGQRFVMIRGDDPSVSRQIVIVHNWFDELKRRVPSSTVSK